jgi:hypothetical protein
MMKSTLNKISIFALTAVFLSATVLCCCLAKPVNAKQPASSPSCHQTTSDAQPVRGEAQECCCGDSLTAMEEGAVIVDIVLPSISLGIDQPLFNFKVASLNDQATYPISPQVHDTLPLYLKHSILRL